MKKIPICDIYTHTIWSKGASSGNLVHLCAEDWGSSPVKKSGFKKSNIGYLLFSFSGMPYLEAFTFVSTFEQLCATLIRCLVFRSWTRNNFENRFLQHDCVLERLLIVISYSLWYFAQITLKDGGKVPVRIVIGEFFKTSAWHNTKRSFFTFYSSQESWSQAYSDSWNMLDLSGELNAFKVIYCLPYLFPYSVLMFIFQFYQIGRYCPSIWQKYMFYFTYPENRFTVVIIYQGCTFS